MVGVDGKACTSTSTNVSIAKNIVSVIKSLHSLNYLIQHHPSVDEQ